MSSSSTAADLPKDVQHSIPKKKLARSPPKPNNQKKFNQLEWISRDSPIVKETTAFEHVPYSSIHGDGAAEKKEVIQSLVEAHCMDDSIKHDSLKHGVFGQEYLDLMILTNQNPGESSVTVGPVLQVDTVRIYNKNSPRWNKFKIYGEITVVDDKDNAFYIYKCPSSTADIVSPPWNYLHLDCSSIAPVLRGNVYFRLTAMDHNVKGHHLPSFNGVINLDKSTQDKGGVFTLTYYGSYGYFLQMRFTKIPYAAICKVIMFLSHTPTEDDKENVSTFGIYGTVKVNNIVSFDLDREDPEEADCGEITSLGQSRRVYALPVHSASDVTVELFRDGDLVFGETLTLFPNLRQGDSRTFEFPSSRNNGFSFLMDLRWARHEDFFGCHIWSSDLNVKWNPNIAPITQKYEQVETSMSPLVEVFSVYVGACDSSAAYPLALCGKILVRDANAKNYVFFRNKDFPQKLSGGLSRKTISLTWPDDGWIVEKDFLMHLKLDDIHGCKVTGGTLQFPYRRLSFTPYNAPYDRRMCDFIHGENGYFVAVHYSIFRNGKKARIQVKWKGCESLVYGSVVAEYGDQCYLSSYDKEFYRSIIFKRSARECLKVEKESELPLSKSNISAPASCKKLSVCVNLLHCSFKASTSGVRPIKCVLPFKAGCNAERDLKGILVEVKWF